MSHRTVSWTRIDRAGRDSRPTIPAGLLSATARIDMTVRTTRRPLYASGKFDRAAIMSAAAKAAHAHQERFGCQKALERDPGSACNWDPFASWVRCG